MATYSSSLIQMSGWNGIAAESHRPVLRPMFYVTRPYGLMVPLIAMDELPAWLEFVMDYQKEVDVRNMYPASHTVHPRIGEYDVICVFCENTMEHADDLNLWKTSKSQDLDQKTHALARRQYPPSMYPTSYYHNTMLWRTFPGDNVVSRPSYLYRNAERQLNPQASVFTPSSEVQVNGHFSRVSPNSFELSNSTIYTPNSWLAISSDSKPPKPPSDDNSHTEYEETVSSTNSSEAVGQRRQIMHRATTFHGHPEVRRNHKRLSRPFSKSAQK